MKYLSYSNLAVLSLTTIITSLSYFANHVYKYDCSDLENPNVGQSVSCVYFNSHLLLAENILVKVENKEQILGEEATIAFIIFLFFITTSTNAAMYYSLRLFILSFKNNKKPNNS